MKMFLGQATVRGLKRMSYVFRIERSNKPLQQAELVHALDGDLDLVRESETRWRWHSGTDTMYLNLGDDSMWTDGSQKWAAPAANEKLRQIAVKTGARLLGEEGEDLTDVRTAHESVGWDTVGPWIAAALLLPIVFLIVLIHLPRFIWSKLKPK